MDIDISRYSVANLVNPPVHHCVHRLLARVVQVRAQRARHPAVREADGGVEALARESVGREFV